MLCCSLELRMGILGLAYAKRTKSPTTVTAVCRLLVDLCQEQACVRQYLFNDLPVVSPKRHDSYADWLLEITQMQAYYMFVHFGSDKLIGEQVDLFSELAAVARVA